MKTAGSLAVLLLQMGAPDTPEAVTPFLENLFSDEAVIPLRAPAWIKGPLVRMMARSRAKRVVPRYGMIGGGSPLVRITREQAAALEGNLADEGLDIPVRAGTRYCPPRAGETISELRDRGVERFLALSLYPHYSTATTGSSLLDLEDAALSVGGQLVCALDSWGGHPGYVDLLAGWINREVARLGGETKGDVHALFSAHNLPKKLIDRGDPYLDELEETFGLVSGKLTRASGVLCFQSSVGPMEWLSPTTDEVLEDLARKGAGGVIMVPVSFVSDHIETLYDMDILYRKKAAELGIPAFSRLPAFNDHPAFISLLADLVKGALEEIPD